MKKKLNHYSDALYWAMSPKSRDKDYHITRLQESILRKLLHYSKSKENITYSNAIIAEHTFLNEETLRKEIPNLVRKGVIWTSNNRIHVNGKFKTRRAIFIIKDKLDFILSEVPKKEKQEELSLSGTTQEDGKLPGKKQEEVVLSANTEDNSKNDFRVPEKKHQEIPTIIVTDEKLNWVRMKTKQNEITKEFIESQGQEELELLFYGEDGIWIIDDMNFENKHLIKMHYRGGGECRLSNQKVKGVYLRLNYHDLLFYLKNKGIGFGDMTPDILKQIDNNGLPKRKLNGNDRDRVA